MEKIPVFVMTVMSDKGIEPFRAEYEDKEGLHKVKITRILKRDKQASEHSMNGLRSTTYSFWCEAARDGQAIPFKLTFNSDSCRWYMYIN